MGNSVKKLQQFKMKQFKNVPSKIDNKRVKFIKKN